MINFIKENLKQALINFIKENLKQSEIRIIAEVNNDEHIAQSLIVNNIDYHIIITGEFFGKSVHVTCGFKKFSGLGVALSECTRIFNDDEYGYSADVTKCYEEICEIFPECYGSIADFENIKIEEFSTGSEDPNEDFK